MTNLKLASVGLALILCAMAVTSAEARTRHQASSADISFDRHDIRGGFHVAAATSPETVTAKRISAKHKHKAKRERRDIPARYAGGRQIVANPAGCRSTRFCGCGTSKYLLGKVVNEGGLAVAANWLKFPRAACAPRMAAARHGHVFAIIECLPGNKALAYDPNGVKGHRTAIHVRSLAGYTVVNPHSRYASAG